MDLTAVPEPLRDTAAVALQAAFGDAVDAIAVADGGASGAHKFRVETSTGPHLLRLEAMRGPLRNPHQYACLRAASDAGIAPPTRFADDALGALVMPWLDVRPLVEYPGGPSARARAVGELLARLHALTPVFPQHGDYLDNLTRLLGFLTASGRVGPGLLEPHRAAFERIRSSFAWNPDEFVSAHNDPNEFNLLFDGRRLWLIDWETASRNDPFIDLATAAVHAAPTEGLRDELLAAALGRAPSGDDRARLGLAGLLTQLYGGCILLLITTDPAVPTHTDLTAPTAEEFRAHVASG
ncbi:MAG: hypothetical protein QOI61_2545, partial [Actinomycetota bacterium]